MKEFNFNYCIPREWLEKKTGEIKYSLPAGNEKMEVGTLDDIHNKTKESKSKASDPYCQVFNNGWRVTTENVNFSDWNGFTFSDIDSKHFYNDVKQFNTDKVLEKIVENGELLYEFNFYACYKTNSGTSYRILFYWDCERTHENFKKCAILTDIAVKDIFYEMGEQGKQIIDYKGFGKDKKQVLDSCSRSLFQGFYVTKNKIYYNSTENINNEYFGKCYIEDIKIEDAYEMTNKNFVYDPKIHAKSVSFIRKDKVNKEKIGYYSHPYRRCLYESLILLFGDKQKVNEEWEYIASLIPEENGHTKNFYLKEPDVNKWYKRFNPNEKTSLHWLENFGYIFNDKTDYVYNKVFRRSWKKHVIKSLIEKIANALMIIWETENTKAKKEEIKKQREKFITDITNLNLDLFNEDYETYLKTNSISSNYGLEEEIENSRKIFYRTQWEPYEFKYLCDERKIAEDMDTYKYYADFYYRDKHNLPTIRYNIIDDELDVYNFDPREGMYRWHVLAYDDEYTNWKNHDAFSIKCSKSDMKDGLRKYAERNHGFNPIRKYFNDLDLSKADFELLETWPIKYFGCDDNIYVREVAKKYFIAACKKQMISEDELMKWVFPHTLFLQGASGTGKTAFMTKMFTLDRPYIVNDMDPNTDDKMLAPKICKNWLIQFNESTKLTKADVNAQKEFVDRINAQMQWQKKFREEVTKILPRVVCCRSTNEETLFNDISVDIDRRNWLLVVKTPEQSCGESLVKQFEENRDKIWAAAYKTLLENPNINLELSYEAMSIMGKIQEDYKMIKKSDIENEFENIFRRKYLTNDKMEIISEDAFLYMLNLNEDILKDLLPDGKPFYSKDWMIQKYISKIPCSWVGNYMKKKFGNGLLYREFRKKLIGKQISEQSCRYNNKITKCFIVNEHNELF